jgi:hypothetical protein
MPKKFKNKAERRVWYKETKRSWRLRNPILSAYGDLRARAKKRKKTCGITLAEFTELCMNTGYHLLKGNDAQSATLDRIKDHIGYEKGNIQVITRLNNTEKENLRRKGQEWEPNTEDFGSWKSIDDIENF